MQVPLLLLLAASAAARDVHASLSTSPVPAFDSPLRRERCATLGFDVDALDCCLCRELSTFLTSSSASKKKLFDTVGQECQECCSDFSKGLDAKGQRYANVVLALSPRRWRRYPKVAHFVEHEAAKLTRLEVREVETRLPMLQFFDKDQLVEEISIAHWDEKSIAEFIDNKLLPEEDENEEDEQARVAVVEKEVDAVNV
uniref:Selenoprotein F n=1 Tax=Peronospora matthiolae TaxID=2874970 RepID=A0AAV1T791_9STRA